jgi:cell division transport system permease protein
MMGWLFVSPAERRLLPGGKFRGPTPWVIAIMTFVMMIVTAAALALANGAGAIAQGSESRFVAQIPDARALPRGVALLRGTAGVSKLDPVTEPEMRKTLEQWLGSAASSSELPVPALIHFDLSKSESRGAVEARLRSLVPGATVTAHEQQIKPLVTTMRALQALSLALVLLMLIATSATVVLSARGALDTNRATIEVMHGVGATDIQVAHLFQRKVALDALIGALTGSGIAAVVLLLLASAGAALSNQLGGLPPLYARDLLLLLVLPFGVAILATLVARTAVLSTLRRAI